MWTQAFPGYESIKHCMRMAVEHPDEYGDLAPLSVIVHVLPYGVRVGGKVYWSRGPRRYFPAVNKVTIQDEYCTFELDSEEHFIQAKVESEGLIIDYWRGEEVVDSLAFLWDDFLEGEDDS
jgi:hypothetical protein